MKNPPERSLNQNEKFHYELHKVETYKGLINRIPGTEILGSDGF
jgi:hypothetical protein